MSESVSVRVAGETMVLFADRAMYWPRQRTLFIADLHLGKADTFRSAGIALPRGGTRHDLDRLTRLIDASGCAHLFVLGDMLHSSATERNWREAWETWRSRHSSLTVDVIAGNHDRALEAAQLEVAMHTRERLMPPFLLRHAPKSDVLHVLCGHIHPVVRLPGVMGRWPAFVLDEGQTILPAFSAFTGGAEIDRVHQRLAVCNASDIALLESSRG